MTKLEEHGPLIKPIIPSCMIWKPHYVEYPAEHGSLLSKVAETSLRAPERLLSL